MTVRYLRGLCLALLAVVSVSLAEPAFAQAQFPDQTDDMNVTLTVDHYCDVAVTDHVDFSFTAALTTPNPAETDDGTLDVTCTETTPYTISIGLGNHAVVSQRRMQGGTTTTNYLEYGLALVGSPSAGTGAAQSYTVTGTLGAGQAVTPDTYSDTVVITIAYGS
jgi:spore coat protein U-like protein